MSQKKHLKLPERRSDILEHEIIFDLEFKDDSNYREYCYKKNTSKQAISIANQFFAIEEILLEAFLYVLPMEQNGSTCSAKFATVIRESCNVIEILFKNVYFKYFAIEKSKKLNIFDFLSLDLFLNFSEVEIISPTLECYHDDKSGIRPFKNLKTWDRNCKIEDENIPEWWKSYNNIKHDINGLRTYATLNNAIYSFSALFILIRIIYGDGLICGFLRKLDRNSGQILALQVRKSDIFFGEVLRLGQPPFIKS